MMVRRIFLVPEIHFINFPLFFLLSFIYEIKTLKIRLPRFYPFKKRIELIRLDDHFNWEECMAIKANAVKIWEDILLRFPESKWKVDIKNSEVNMTMKAIQEMQREFENMFFLRHIADHTKSNHNVFIIDSLYFSFIKSIDKNNDIFLYPISRFMSLINVVLSILVLNCIIYLMTIKLIAQLIYGLWNRKYVKQDLSAVKYIWDGISPRELSVSKEKNTFSWIIDDNFIRKENILFLLPKPDFQMKSFSEDEAKKRGVLIANHVNMACFSSTRNLFSALNRALRLAVKNIILPKFNLIEIMNTKYTLQVLKWVPIIDYLKPKVYINSFSNIGSEDTAVIYFQKAGIKSIMWAYGTNSYLFTTKAHSCDFRNIIYCNILSSTLVVWNNHFKRFIESHPQDKLEIITLGPLMCGDESVCNMNRNVLNKKIGFNRMQNDRNFKYIAVFDVPPVSKASIGSEAVYPDSNSEEYNYAFMKDILRLLADFENVCLIYKPKRSLTSGKFSYSNETGEILEAMSKSFRVKIVDYNINPWVPIASADMTISMPFESPFIASLHYGKPALFHDPMNIVSHHRYHAVSDLITHNYEELKLKVNYWLFESREGHLDVVNESKFKDFVGTYPLTNSSKRFREYLANISRGQK